MAPENVRPGAMVIQSPHVSNNEPSRRKDRDLGCTSLESILGFGSIETPDRGVPLLCQTGRSLLTTAAP
jgi:hypothetical protein